MQQDNINIGMKFGLLTVIGEKEKVECRNNPGHYATMIKCRCSCPSHTELYVMPSHLKNHLVTSCGCKKKRSIKVGLKSGELEVVEIGIFKEKNGYQ